MQKLVFVWDPTTWYLFRALLLPNVNFHTSDMIKDCTWDVLEIFRLYQKISKTLENKHTNSRLPIPSISLPHPPARPALGLRIHPLREKYIFTIFSLSRILGIDWRYQIWKVGVTMTDQSFLYQLCYFLFSIFGNCNYFFFAAHLIDVAVGVPALRIILQVLYLLSFDFQTVLQLEAFFHCCNLRKVIL